MLVLSRLKNQSIVIGDREIVITVVEVRGDKVRLGIVTSPDIPVHREEVYEAIKHPPKVDPKSTEPPAKKTETPRKTGE